MMPVYHFNKIIFVLFIFINSPLWASEKDNSDVKRLLEQNRYSQAEILLDEKIKSKPDNIDLRFQLARVLAWQKKYRQSIIQYDWLLKKYPANSDYQFGKAQTLHWAGQDPDALKLLESARATSPGYQDIWHLLISILQKSNNKADQEKAKQLMSQAKKRFPQATWLKQPAQKKVLIDTRYTEVELGTNADILNNNYDNWSSIYLSGEHQYKNGSKIYAAATQNERFKLSDEEVLLGYFTPLSTHWNIVADVLASPSHKVRPKWSAFAQLQRRFQYGWNGYLGLRNTEYNETTTQALNISLERYWQNFRFAYTGYVTQVSGAAISSETLNTHTLAADYYYGERNNFAVALTSGKELEYTGTASPPTSEISAVVLKGRHWFIPKWAISYELYLHEQGSIYTRHGYRLGLRYRY